MNFRIENYFDLRGSVIGGGGVVGRSAVTRRRIVIRGRGIIFYRRKIGL